MTPEYARKLEQNALYVMDAYDHPALHQVARFALAALANPETALPDGYAVVKKPELLGVGVPSRG